MKMKYAATNPVTKMTFTAEAGNRDDFLLTLVRRAPDCGWKPNEVKECVDRDMIKEAEA
jgi:hypothetical protein